MSYFKDPDNSLHFIDDDAYDYMLPAGCVQIPDEEAQSMQPKPDPEARTRAETITKIQALEAKQPRAIREAVLTGDKVRLQAIEDQIVELRAKLV